MAKIYLIKTPYGRVLKYAYKSLGNALQKAEHRCINGKVLVVDTDKLGHVEYREVAPQQST